MKIAFFSTTPFESRSGLEKYESKEANGTYFTEQSNQLKRYTLFFLQPHIIFINAFNSAGMLFIKTSQLTFGLLGFVKSNSHKRTVTTRYIETNFPIVSFIIPTLNADKYLQACLESIRNLDYPSSKIEIFIADGGSTDMTLVIAKQFNTVILKNLKVIAEYGKYIAYKKASGKYLVFLDADNVIASKDWLTRILYPLENDGANFAESNYLIASDFSLINQYATLLVIVDPLARMWASRPKIQHTEWGSYRLFKKGDSPVAGANGFVWRTKTIDEHFKSDNVLNEADMLNRITAQESIKIANMSGVGIYHYYCESIGDYIKKRKKIANKYLNRRLIGDTWAAATPLLRKYLAVFYLATFIGPLIEAFWHIIKTKQIAWILHPFISMATISIYIYYFINFDKNVSRTK